MADGWEITRPHDPVQIDLGPIDMDLATYAQLLTGSPLTGQVVGGPLDGLDFEIDSIAVDTPKEF